MFTIFKPDVCSHSRRLTFLIHILKIKFMSNIGHLFFLSGYFSHTHTHIILAYEPIIRSSWLPVRIAGVVHAAHPLCSHQTHWLYKEQCGIKQQFTVISCDELIWSTWLFHHQAESGLNKQRSYILISVFFLRLLVCWRSLSLVQITVITIITQSYQHWRPSIILGFKFKSREIIKSQCPSTVHFR